ncbi:hypothetical protein SY83_09695 [Paenibacillus swuensis]|uniref:Uncharacterized protein n=1 Tax=Paenibacillus swuensis TaxID=1178515 RepID=A0A172THR8_9BACL|nr:hypothetical protein [Paenibacillus swuensis]ANE46506.1 hypothetical protein SY83_09695 [Paenibacillus swuensis]
MLRSRMKKRYTFKAKVVTGIVSLIIVIAGTTGISYADVDIAGSLRSWYSSKTESAVSSLEQAVQSETDQQKAILKEELQRQLEQSAKDLDAFTEEQKQLHIAAIQQYANTLLQNVEINSKQDRQQILAKLQLITDSAVQAMNALVESYEPPAVTYASPVQTEDSVQNNVYRP